MKKKFLALAFFALAALSHAGLQDWRDSYVAADTYQGESRMQFLFSYRYGIPTWPVAPYFAYQGLYDFDFGTRYSDPIVSRGQNPGILLCFDNLGLPLAAGYFHESNGQEIGSFADTDNKTQAKAELAARRLRLSNSGSDAAWAQDYVSRGWDYWHLGYAWTGAAASRWSWKLEPELRLYTGKQGVSMKTEEELWWDASAGPSYINQYDGLRLYADGAYTYPGGCKVADFLRFKSAGLKLYLRTGYNGLGQNLSVQTSLDTVFGPLPLFFYYQSGYGPYIADYASFHKSGGVGIRLKVGH